MAMFDQDFELADVIDHDAAGVGSMYLKLTSIFFFVLL